MQKSVFVGCVTSIKEKKARQVTVKKSRADPLAVLNAA
jgi:hypothetical protein